MSIDKPSGGGDSCDDGESRPDQPYRPEDRPFPGQRRTTRPEAPPSCDGDLIEHGADGGDVPLWRDQENRALHAISGTAL